MSHFTFYNHTIGPKAECILKHYMSGKIPQISTGVAEQNTTGGDNQTPTTMNSPRISVDILPWNLKMKSQKEIRTEGLFASLNDCLYRSMYR